MTSMDVERVRYFERQYLESADFIAEQAYHRDMRRRHNLSHHTRGIVVGLRLVERANGSQTEVWLEPGMAVDGYGREILVLAPTRLDAVLFNRIKAEKYAEVWIGYAETDAELPPPGWEQCDVADAYRRTVEAWMLVVDPGSTTHADVIVDGRALPEMPPAAGDPALPLDESVPYQELPDQMMNPLWLLRLGTVHWMGADFGTTDPAVLTEAREYVGAVTGHVLTPADRLRVRPRKPFADVDKQSFASVEGRLRVDGRLTAERDVWVNRGKVWFNEKLDPEDPKDLPTDPPLWVTRTQGPDLKGDVIRVQLGEDKGASGTALSIGPKDGPKDKAVLAVGADDVVDIDTGTLRTGSLVRQMIDLWRGAAAKPGEAGYGIGVQNKTLYQRSDFNFAWFRGGKHDDATGVPGAGGTQQMLLDDAARLTFDSETMRQVLNVRKKTHGVGIQPNTLYFRSPGGFAWFKGGAEAVNDGDAGGGISAMTLNASNLLAVNGSGEFNGSLSAAANLVAGNNANGYVLARHVEGKSAGSNSADDLYLNWINGKDVRVGARFARNSSLYVSGGLFVDGTIDSVIKVKTYARAYENAGGGNPTPDVPRSWSINLGGEFTTVYTAFAVLGGFSLWGNEDETDPQFSTKGHARGDNAIPQHVFARVTGVVGHNVVNGTCYCSESDPSVEGDNTVLFTVVVLGRHVTS